MIILYLIIIFFIIIFNILIPNLIEKIKIDNEILESNLGKGLLKVTCNNNYWFYLEKNIKGMNLHYLIDNDNKMIPCDKDFSDIKRTKICGLEGEFNSRLHPCFFLISELLFYKNNY